MPEAMTQQSAIDRRKNLRRARSAARLAAVQALYQLEMTGQSWREVMREFETYRLGAEIEGAQYIEADRDYFRSLLEGVVANQRDIDRIIDEALVENWPLGKVDPTLRAIFRCGGCEFKLMSKTPPRVTISEYVDVAKAFFGQQDAARFVNAVLDAMARVWRKNELDPK
jgi:N utilization substance protein B